MFKSDAKLFLSANNNVNSAKTLINECKRLVTNFGLDTENFKSLKKYVNNCDVDSLITKIENTKESLMKLDQDFSNEYMTLLNEFFQTSLIDTSNMTDSEKMQYNIQMDSYARDYNTTLLYMLEKYEESGMLTDEMKQQLEYQRTIVAQYAIVDEMSVLDSRKHKYIELYEQYAEYDKTLISLNPNLTNEEKEKYLSEYNVKYALELFALKKARKEYLKEKELKEELEDLIEAKNDNNGFWHPFAESEINEAILDTKIELGIATEDEIDYKNMNGFERFVANSGTFVASTYTGLFGITENIGDSIVTLGGALHICDKEWAAEYVATDLSAELYQGIQLSTGMNEWSAYGDWHSAGESFGSLIGRVGMTFSSPWACAAFSGFDSMGGTAEKAFANGDEYWAALLKGTVSGVGGAVSGYAFSKMNMGIKNYVTSGALKTTSSNAIAGVKNFVTSGALKSTGGNAIASIKRFALTCTSIEGIKVIGGTAWEFIKANAKTVPSLLGKGALKTLKDSDVLIETGCTIVNDIVVSVQNEKFEIELMLSDVGNVFKTNYFTGCANDLGFINGRIDLGDFNSVEQLVASNMIDNQYNIDFNAINQQPQIAPNSMESGQYNINLSNFNGPILINNDQHNMSTTNAKSMEYNNTDIGTGIYVRSDSDDSINKIFDKEEKLIM